MSRLSRAKTGAWTVGGALLLAAAVALSCSKDPRFEDRTLYVYSPRACPVTQSQAYSVIYGGGDFEPAADHPPVASMFLRDVGAVLSDLPGATRSVLVDVSQPAQSIDWRGIAEVPASGPINVLVWPGGESCRLTRNVELRQDSTFATFGNAIMIAGGVTTSGGQVPHTFVGDLSTGILEALPFGLGTRRSFATITSFRANTSESPGSALVAGGEDPDSHTALNTAEVYVPKADVPGNLGDFERSRVELSEPRTKHGAVVLASQSTLLVGGIGQGGTTLRTMEIIDPTTRQYRTNGVALLAVARSSPNVMRLASGEVLVAGGFDSKGEPVSRLEWFSADVSRTTKRSLDLVTGRERAFVPLDAGGALAVIAPKDITSDFKTVWMISADGTLEPAVPIDPAELDEVRLFEGPEGAPLLWTGRRWMRWQPWFGAFQAVADAPEVGPTSKAIVNGDKGLALWLEDLGDAGMYVQGFRFATRSRFSTVPKPLLVDGPGGLVPDRLTGIAGSSIRFTNDAGLELGPGASAFVPDVTFANVSVEIDVTLAAPEIVLRQEDGRELDVGGAACAFAQSARTTLAVERSGTQVRVRIDGAEARLCPTELDTGARVSVGLRGASGAEVSGARNLRVTRL